MYLILLSLYVHIQLLFLYSWQEMFLMVLYWIYGLWKVKQIKKIKKNWIELTPYAPTPRIKTFLETNHWHCQNT